MGDILIIAGIAGLAACAIAAPVAAALLRRRLKKLRERIREEYGQ